MKIPVFSMQRTTQPSGGKTPAEEPESRWQGWNALAMQENTGIEGKRTQILNQILIAAGGLGTLLYLLSLPGMISAGHWAGVVVYGVVCAALTALAALQRLPSILRAAGLLLAVFAVGVMMLLDQGLAGNGRIMLVLAMFLGTFTLGSGRLARLIRLGAALLSILALFIVGILAVSGYLAISSTSTSFLPWLVGTAGLFLAALVSGLALNAYLRSLENQTTEALSAAQGFDQERQRLESQIQNQGKDLERRLVQIRTAAEISKSISSMLDQSTLLKQVCELVKERFGLYYVGLFLLEPGGAGEQYAVLAAGTGEAGVQMIAERHRLQVGGDSMIGWATANRQARIALDVGKEAVRFDNPHLPLTRSELALPILSQHALIGAMSIQSEAEAAFDQDDILVLQGIADVLAGAIENARLFAETQANLEEIRSLHRQYLKRAWSEALERMESREYSFERQDELTPGEEALRAAEFPIRLREQQIGSLMLETDASRNFSEEELALIDSVVNQAALALENARLLEESRLTVERERTASTISAKVWASGNIDMVLRTTLLELAAALDAEQGVIELLPEPMIEAGSHVEETIS
jgi:GAF domain-containing protein